METLSKDLQRVLAEERVQDAINQLIERGDAPVSVQLADGRNVTFRRVEAPAKKEAKVA